MNWTGAQKASGEEASQVKSSQVKEASDQQACALFTGSTGWLDESSCEWAGHQCVCELGAELLPAYSRSMLSSRQARDRDAGVLRKYAVTLFSMALGLPLLLDKRVLHIGQWVVNRGRGSASADGTPAPSRETVHRTLAVHVAWALVFVGWGPFLWQAVGGNWHAARLGCWPNYTPIGPIGMWIICETAPLRHFYVAGLVLGMLLLAISAVIVYWALLKELYQGHTVEVFGWVIPEPEVGDRWLHAHNVENSSAADGSMTMLRSIPLICFWIASTGPRIPQRPAHQMHAIYMCTC